MTPCGWATVDEFDWPRAFVNQYGEVVVAASQVRRRTARHMPIVDSASDTGRFVTAKQTNLHCAVHDPTPACRLGFWRSATTRALTMAAESSGGRAGATALLWPPSTALAKSRADMGHDAIDNAVANVAAVGQAAQTTAPKKAVETSM
jgi:hypothetical protein